MLALRLVSGLGQPAHGQGRLIRDHCLGVEAGLAAWGWPFSCALLSGWSSSERGSGVNASPDWALLLERTAAAVPAAATIRASSQGQRRLRLGSVPVSCWAVDFAFLALL